MFDQKPKQLLLLIDGNALVHRGWHAIQRPLNLSSTGEDVRGVFGFFNSFLKVISDWNPTHCAIAFDLPGPTFRHKIYDKYKAHRPKTPDDLRNQFRWVRKVIDTFKIPVFQLEGYEADDVLATLSKTASENVLETLILTGDTDTLQLVSESVRVLLQHRIQEKKVFDVTAVEDKFGGLSPTYQTYIKALLGDVSDNVPGVPGIGQKTAIKLIQTFGTIDEIYKNIDIVSPQRIKQSLIDNREQTYQGLKLVTLVDNLPIDFDLEIARCWQFDRLEVVNLFRELEFFTIVPRIPYPYIIEKQFKPPKASTLKVDYEKIVSYEALQLLCTELKNAQGFAFDTETTGKNSMNSELVGLSFSNDMSKGWYIPVGHKEGQQLSLTQVLTELKPLLEDPNIPKVAHNANYDMMILENYDIKVKNISFDTMIAAFLLGKKSVGLKALALDYLAEEMTPITDLIGTGKTQITMAEVPIDKVTQYACADANFTWRLKDLLDVQLEKKGLSNLFFKVEIPLIPVIVDMQVNGLSLNIELLNNLSHELKSIMSNIESTIYQLVGHQFNINSSQQLGQVLFKELRLPPTKRTKTGYSTDASSLDNLKLLINTGATEGVNIVAIEVLDLVMEYRQNAKIKSTYSDALPRLVNEKTGRLHTSYNQTGPATGRVSSNHPNVQNIPVRTELGRKVRQAFTVKDTNEFILLAADYSQIELRVLAHLSKDESLIEAFLRGEDIHAATASQMFEVDRPNVTLEMRRIAKVLNFGVIYGLSPFGISQQTGITPQKGKDFIDTYFGKYPGIKAYIEFIKEKIRQDGYVETILGRRREVPEIRSSNYQVRQAAERMAVNMPIQGSAADILKLAMINIQSRIEDLCLKTIMIVQVHDELIFEVPNNELGHIKSIVLELMPSAMKLDVPLEVEVKTGLTWGEMD